MMTSMEKSYDEVENPNSFAFQGFASTKFTYFNDDTLTPSPQLLHAAALKGNATLLKVILDYKVPVDIKDQVILFIFKFTQFKYIILYTCCVMILKKFYSI